MKKLKIAMLLVIVLALVLSFTNVYAATTTINATSTTKTLTITRKVENVTNPVTNTFTYKIEADASNPAAVTGLPADGTTSVVFNAVAPNASTHIAQATGTLDLSGVTFTQVGDYKFKVTELSSTDADTYPVDDSCYYEVEVSVRYAIDGSNVPDNDSLVATLASQTLKDGTGSKVDMEFKSGSELTYVELSKNVTGNLAEKDEYFAFTVNIPGTTGDVYKVIGNHSVNGSDTVATSDYTVGTTTTLYLKHGQTVTIGKTADDLGQIKIGTVYTITETGAADYKTYIDGSNTDNKATGNKTTVATSDASFNTADKTAFVNNKEANVVTGVVINIAPFAVLVVLAGVGIYAIRKSSRG